MIPRSPLFSRTRSRIGRTLSGAAVCALLAYAVEVPARAPILDPSHPTSRPGESVTGTAGSGGGRRQQSSHSVAVGVLDLDPINVDASYTRIISDRLRLYVANQPVFDLVERNRMADLMAEYGFQLSGACASDDCAIQIGKVLSARMMIAGSVGRIETLYTLQVRLIDTETSKVVFTAFSDAGSVAQVLESATATVARELALQLTQGADTKAPALQIRGRLNVRSDPPGATILVGGQRAGTTPATLTLYMGSYEIGLEYPGFKPFSGNVDIIDAGSGALEAILERAVTGFADIRSEPLSASVFIDDEHVGMTPLTHLELPVGAHRVVFRLAGYRAETAALEIAEDRTSTINTRLSGTGSGILSVLSEPRNCTVRINDAVAGSTPLLLPLPEGSYRVKISQEGYGSVTKVVSVTGGRQTEVNIRLQPLPPPR